MDNKLSIQDSKLSLLESQVFGRIIYGVEQNFKDWLLGVIQERKTTYESFGNEIGVSHGAVGGWVRGKYLPDPVSLKRLAEITNVDPIWLFRLVGYLPPSGESGGAEMRPKVLSVLRELETLPDEILDLLADQIRHVLRPRAKRFEEGERAREKAAETPPDSGDAKPSE